MLIALIALCHLYECIISLNYKYDYRDIKNIS